MVVLGDASHVVLTEKNRMQLFREVDLFFAPHGRQGDQAVVVGHAVTTVDGSWAAVVNVPRELELKDYDVFASTPGDDNYQPSLSE